MWRPGPPTGCARTSRYGPSGPGSPGPGRSRSRPPPPEDTATDYEATRGPRRAAAHLGRCPTLMVRAVAPTGSVHGSTQQSASGRQGTGGGMVAIGGYGELARYG